SAVTTRAARMSPAGATQMLSTPSRGASQDSQRPSGEIWQEVRVGLPNSFALGISVLPAGLFMRANPGAVGGGPQPCGVRVRLFRGATAPRRDARRNRRAPRLRNCETGPPPHCKECNDPVANPPPMTLNTASAGRRRRNVTVLALAQ